MILSVANPIYDTVFKYLMEDERIAKTVLSALLKKQVVSVEMRRHEHTNITRDTISMFRVDFAARVREEDGSIRLVLIELQKTWLETETLRFRQYLGAQYNAQENMYRVEEERKSYGVPMIAVYLLGHRVGKIDKPVVYVTHDTYDYEGRTVEEGRKDPFIRSLVHDSIIVQIPLLHGRINNRLDKVLSVFDQTLCARENRQVINVDEKVYEGDEDMMYILHRLSSATVNAELRQEMNVEDEYFSAIEDRDTTIMNLDKIIAKNNETIAKNNETIAKNNETIAKNNTKLQEQKSQLQEKDSLIEKQKSVLRNLAKGMLQNGMSEETVSQMTGLSVEDVGNLLK